MIYDFTNSVNKAYGNNLTLQGSRYCFYSGDINKDDVIDVKDLGNIDNASFNFLQDIVRGYIRRRSSRSDISRNN